MATKETVFLSYEREQLVTEFAIKLKNDLEGKGLSIWLDIHEESDTEPDQHEILPLNDHRMTKEKALETCRGLVALLTKGYMSSRHCMEEFFMASNREKRIFPIIYEDGWNTDSLDSESSRVMYTLSAIHIEWAMFRPGKDDYVESLTMLVENMMLTLALPLLGMLYSV